MGRCRGLCNWIDGNLPNGQVLWGWAMWSCTGVYLVVALWQKWRGHPPFDLDKLLHRGKYEIQGEVEAGTVETNRGWRVLAINSEFSRRDKFLYLLTYGYNLGWVVVFIIATVFFLTRRIEGSDWSRYDALWLGFWHIRQWIEMGISLVVIVWFTIGGVRDVKALLKALDERKRDEADDGFIPRD